MELERESGARSWSSLTALLLRIIYKLSVKILEISANIQEVLIDTAAKIKALL